MGFAYSRRTENQNIRGLVNPLGFGGELLNREGVNLREMAPVEIGNRFCVWQLGFGECSLEA